VAQYNLGLVFVCRGQYGAALAHLRTPPRWSRRTPTSGRCWARRPAYGGHQAPRGRLWRRHSHSGAMSPSGRPSWPGS
jgi:hypothetical protein